MLSEQHQEIARQFIAEERETYRKQSLQRRRRQRWTLVFLIGNTACCAAFIAYFVWRSNWFGVATQAIPAVASVYLIVKTCQDMKREATHVRDSAVFKG